MSEQTNTAGDAGGAGVANGALPSVATSLTAERVVAALDRVSRRGKLPGYHGPKGGAAAGGGASGDGPLFTMTDFGRPFEYVLEARHRTRSGASGAGGYELGFRMRMKPLVPWIYAVVLVATVWPGVWLTDSMIKTYFSGYGWTTAYWYVPLTAPFVPWGMWSAVKKSRKSAQAEALTLIEDVRKTLAGEEAI